MTTRVGFVGIGRMGKPMCQHILQAGFPLTIFDVIREATSELAARGARVAGSLRETASESDVMIVMVADDAQVREVVDGKNGLLDGAKPGAVIAICASVHPNTCRDLAASAAKRSVGLVDAPVARGERGAEAGELTVFVGGEKKFVETCRPVFGAFAKTILHMGKTGAGQMTKTCNNLMHWAEVAACYEVLTFGKKLGLDPKELREAMLAGSADSRTLRELHLIGMYWPKKDLDTAMQLAREVDTRLPLIDRTSELVTKISAQDLRALVAER